MRSICTLFLIMIGLSGCGGSSGSSAPSAGAPALTVPSSKSYLAIDPRNLSIAKGTDQQFTATKKDNINTLQDLTAPVTWSSLNTLVATIDPNTGKAKAVSAGQTTITATSPGAEPDKIILTVTNATLTSIAVTALNTIIGVGDSQQYTATGSFSDSSTQNLTTSVSWRSLNEGVATIISNGKATAISVGNTEIIATWESKSVNTALSVTSATLQSITLTPDSPVVTAGISQQFKVMGAFSDGSSRDLTASATWSSDTLNVATIDLQTGKSNTVSEGTTKITAKLGDKSVSTILTVRPAIVSGAWEGTYTIYKDLDATQLGDYYFQLVIVQNGTDITGKATLRGGDAKGYTENLVGKVIGSQIEFRFTYFKSGIEMINIGTAQISDNRMTAVAVKETRVATDSPTNNTTYSLDLTKQP